MIIECGVVACMKFAALWAFPHGCCIHIVYELNSLGLFAVGEGGFATEGVDKGFRVDAVVFGE